MNLPNTLTLIRVLLIPVFVILIMNHSFWWALITFAIAGITDGLDGLLARLTRQKTELGAFLDPIADKLLLISAYLTLAIIEILPGWLSVIVITRDIIILLGILVIMLISHPPQIRPSFISKVTTTFQILTVLLALLTGYDPLFKPLTSVAIYATTCLTILSGIHYIYLGTRILNQKKSTPLH
ncbi:MAG: CDP-diacylglycerol--glycerol-3-phosphate 3-phosphatidyltransferase [Deltaproteobacteria bacterium]|nr:CDP-diacylglycerol--glycerol-3-phosphate 3-phosphatidyltransferase [Deltaproteobacteria bacterium]MBM4323455.1 CDP-diacylglycerol--glycerol-3-phosphate 3-phosphatidyltransferase [Deltaproteobacteria bacterium]